MFAPCGIGFLALVDFQNFPYVGFKLALWDEQSFCKPKRLANFYPCNRIAV